MSIRKFSVGFSLVLFLALAQLAQAANVRVWEERISIPTYLLGPEDPNPQFPLVNSHDIYPYTALDDLTDNREPKTYRAIYLENEYLKATILPQMDGRVYSLYDKVAKREVFYRNNVIKYGMVGLRGAWISGGVEFNFPNGHTTDTVSPVASRFRQNPDGSATAVVGDVDQVSGMHWEVALTLRPGVAHLEQHVTLFNSTPLTGLYWWWANAAVPATDDMQFIYPMRLANPHSHTEIWAFPIWNGVNYSLYKDVHHATSLFGVDVHRQFFGAYYHNSDNGVIHVADYHQVPGKKTWTWGNAGDGRIWIHLLTDNDGQYCEIQAGRFQTQLSQEFIPPQKVESWTEYWYPVAGLDGGFVDGTPQMAINVIYPASDVARKSAVVLAVSPAVSLRGAKIEVKMGSETLKDFSPVSFEPLATRKFTVPVADVAAAKKHLDVTILSAEGKTLLHWYAGDPVDGNPDLSVKPGEQEVNRKPDSELPVEELFLRGVNDEKEGGHLQATDIYKEVLKRDSGYVPALLKLAEQDYYAADFEGAEALMARARARDAKDPRVGYLAGVIYKGAGKMELAEDAFWSSLRFGGADAPALVQLGEIAIQQKQYAQAEKLLRKALLYDPDDGVALSDLAAALRLSGNLKEASEVVNKAVEKMPILPNALAEKWRVEAALGAEPAAQHAAEVFKSAVGYRSQGYLEAGVWYRRLGDLSSSDFFLATAAKTLAVKDVSPLIYYYLAADRWDDGNEQGASAAADAAEKANVEAVFPNRPADAQVLREVLAHNSADAHAKYFLGNFLFAHSHYAEAAVLWRQAVGEGFHYAVLYRNLGVYALRVQNDPASAAAYYATAIKQSPGDFWLYVDLDEIYTQLGKTSDREKLFAGAPAEVLGRDAVRARRVLLNVEERRYDQALDALKGHNFKPWEGGRIIRELFVLANLEKGRQAFEAGQFKVAEESFRAGLEYPENLGVGKPEHPQDEEALYWLGRALDAQGQKSEARSAWQQAADEMPAAEDETEERGGGSSSFYAALALDRLGRSEEASRILNSLAREVAAGRKSAYDYYVAGLVKNYRKQDGQAAADFRRALELNPGFWQARLELQRKGESE
jgi:tetratricopeptide (TPR) repeat protein